MGEVFAGRYELVDPLGEGGAGVVWRAWDRKWQCYTAAKVLRQVDASSLLRFMREQSMRLDHPHVLAPTGWAGEDEKVLFTMPIVRGGSVSTLVNDFGPLPPRLAALLLDQLLAALEAIHAEGIVHRDIKPANLLLDATGRDLPRLWLGDFGIAAGHNAPRLTQGPYAMGTPGYTAPECLHQGWQPDARADLYAAGMCATEMLTGLPPDADTQVLQAFSSAAILDEVPEELVRVAARLSNPVLTERYGSARQARSALRSTGLLEDTSAPEILGEVEVFDHIPELPEGWGAHGPVGAVAAAQPEPAEVPSGGPTLTSPGSPQSVSSPGEASTENVAAPPEHSAEVGMAASAPQRPPFPIQPPNEPSSSAGQHPGHRKPQPAQHGVQAPHSRSRPGQRLAIALILFGVGLVVLAALILHISR